MQHIGAPDIFINGFPEGKAWVTVLTEPQKPPCARPKWSEHDTAVLRAVYPRHGRRIAAYTLGKPVYKMGAKIDYLGLRRTVRPRADTRGGV